MNEQMSKIMDESLRTRRAVRKKPIDLAEIDRRHREINEPGYINRTFGRMGSTDNAIAR